MPGAGSVCSVSAVSRMFLVGSKEQAMAKSNPETKATLMMPPSSYFSFKVVEGREVML